MNEYPWPVAPDGTILVLRNSKLNGASHYTDDFVWPTEGWVEAPDWSPTPECGGGLHGLAWGTGDFQLETGDVLWQIVRVNVADLVDLGDKVKFSGGVVTYSGAELADAVSMLDASGLVSGLRVYGATRTAGDWGTATAGYRGMLVIQRYDTKLSACRPHVAIVGENGIKANVAYRLDNGQFKEAA